MERILIIAQTPPPFHGQAVMQKYLVEVNWDWCKKEFVRMNFSRGIEEVGVLKLEKLKQLLALILQVRKKANPKFELIYYPPGGPNRIPIYRDVVTLLFLKKASRRIVLHFHAGGINQIFDKVSRIESYFIKKAFNGVDACIVLTDTLKNEVAWCRPKKTFIVGNGIEDVFTKFSRARSTNLVSFLFVGNLKREKGIFTLLDAAALLKEWGARFEIRFIGSFHNLVEKEKFFNLVEVYGLKEYVYFLGSKHGDEKWREFANADVLCLPTYETEAMPISILEAMMFSMPVITTNWRSIPDVIRNGENGLLFQPESANELAQCMQHLLHAEHERHQMGKQARKDYLQNFTVEKHLKKMESVFLEILNT